MKRVIKPRDNESNWIGEMTSEVAETCIDFMINEMGFKRNEVDDYYNLTSSETSEEVKLTVTAEISLNNFYKLFNRIDPIVKEYDPESYFDMVDPGIANCIVRKEVVSETLPDFLQEDVLYELADEVGSELGDSVNDMFDVIECEAELVEPHTYRIYLEYRGYAFATLAYIDVDTNEVDSKEELSRELMKKAYPILVENIESL